MAQDPINANPTILNPSDLPTRLTAPQQHSSSSSSPGASKLHSSILFQPSYLAAYLPLTSLDADPLPDSDTDSDLEEIDEQEIYGTTSWHPLPRLSYSILIFDARPDLISTISDPEHPLSLGSLAVVSLPDIRITPPSSPRTPITTVTVLITPTITHCSLATVIGLAVRVRLEQALPPRFRVDVRIKPGSHSTAAEVTKQLADKERVAAALENTTLLGVLRKMLETCV
ncbi:MAG: hypothetical protein M1814_003620 [Vezdaea aestivalis]|nr:MAG: hypothetical protein M1814_003620 [Vezdaea aestivalis]